jgi:hypothetical protein
MNSWILAEYKRLRKLDWTAQDALRAAKIKDEFEDLENEGLVKFDIVPDEILSFNDLKCEGMTKKEEQKLSKRIDRDGVWEIFTSFRVSKSEKWQHVDGVIGFVGDALKEEQEKRWSKEAEELANRATYAGV